ncbi:MAG: F0F1 ATP synthase subunit B [Bacteroidales bacterium]|jgi:F-type H+-transporting ATPase subunit b|nr:F0F1 ATP synthase subunit B [Bacteroidales bacterium]
MELFTPEVGLICWMLVPFLIVFFVLGKFAWPVIIKGVSERANFIDQSIQSAKDANEQLASIKALGETMLTEARNEQLRILNDANQARNQLLDEAKKQAKQEAEKILSAAQLTIQKEKEDISRQVRSEIAVISIGIAEKIIRNRLDASEQEELVNRLVEEANASGKN